MIAPSGDSVKANDQTNTGQHPGDSPKNLNLSESSASYYQPDEESIDNDYSIGQSFEVIRPSSELIMDNTETHDSGEDFNSHASLKPRTNSESFDSSTQGQRKKSGSFLAKLQSSVDSSNRDGPSNLPSSIVSAFSSFSSSFTSNFNPLNSSSTTNNGTASSLTIDETASTSTRLGQITETREDIFNRKAILERKNLIGLTKLIVKDLISSSLLVSRTIDDCHNAVHLNNYFTLIDRVLKHGLKQNLLSNRSANLWNALDSLPKYLKESTLMSESIRSLANTKTPDGKIKAWMRLAMMQKKLPEYFNELLANKSVLLKDIYHDYAFMLNDEAHVFAGLIIGVNVIDCNFFVKDANFDSMDDIIDLGPYLRVANSYDGNEDDKSINASQSGSKPEGNERMTAVLDQKNYLEEWNKRLESTVSDLQAKVKSLEEQNSKLEMEVKLSEARIVKFQEKIGEPTDKHGDNSNFLTGAIKNLMIGNSEAAKSADSSSNLQTLVTSSTITTTTKHEASPSEVSDDEATRADGEQSKNKGSSPKEIRGEVSKPDDQLKSSVEAELRQQISNQERELSSLRERASILEASYRSALEKIKVLERDLDVQTSMNTDGQTTIKIYEKDIREKQAQVESLRASLNEAKKMNSDLSEKLSDANTKMKDRVNAISHLQDSLSKWKLENKTLASRLQDKVTAFKSITNDLEKAMKTTEELKRYNEKINEELRNERESGQSSSVTVEAQNAQIAELNAKLMRAEKELMDLRLLREQVAELSKRCQEYEQSLEEVGSQLRESRLEVENLKENSAVFLDSQWMDSKQIKTCALCQQSFSVTRRKHHCRLCGNVFCQTCSDNKMDLASSSKPVRVCDTCHAFLLAKFVKSST